MARFRVVFFDGSEQEVETPDNSELVNQPNVMMVEEIVEIAGGVVQGLQLKPEE